MIPRRNFYDKESQPTLKFIERWSQEVEGKNSLLLLDIDSTLIDTSYRTAAIFKSFAKEHEYLQVAPEICSLLSNWKDELYEVYDPLEFIRTHSPGIQITKKIEDDLFYYWQQRFFHPAWFSHDQVYSKATPFIQNMAKSVQIGYLTGRCDPILRETTKAQLQTFQLPLAADNLLLMKPEKDIIDLQFKYDGLQKFSKDFRHIIYIDNEVELVNMSLSHFPQIETILFQSVHSGRGRLTQNPQKISSWLTSP